MINIPSIAVNQDGANNRLLAWFLRIVWLLLLLIELYFLVYDMPGFQEYLWQGVIPGHRKQIATLGNRKKTVRFQESGELVWTKVADKQPLYVRQSLLTLDDSSAEVVFQEGSTIHVGENSLIQLSELEHQKADAFNQNDSVVIGLLRGTIRKTKEISGPAQKKMVFKVGQTELHSSPESEFSIVSDPIKKDKFKLSITNGDVKVVSGAKEQLQVREGQEVSLSSEETKDAPVVLTPLYIPVYPSDGQTVRSVADGKLKFRWQLSDRGEQLGVKELLVCTDPNCRANPFKLSLMPGVTKAEVEIPGTSRQGVMYWRLGFASDMQEQSATSFKLENVLPPVPVFPGSLFTSEDDKEIEFAWKEIDSGKEYEIQITPVAGASDGGVIKYETANVFLKIPPLKKGEYIWQIRGKYRDGELTPWSNQGRINVTKKEISRPVKKLPPPPPKELEVPKFERN